MLAQIGPPEAFPPVQTPTIPWADLSPLLVVVGGALAILTLVAVARARWPRGLWALLTLVIAAASLAASLVLWNDVQDNGPRYIIANALAIDGFAVFFFVVISAAIGLGAMLADQYLRREALDGPEFYVLMMLSGAGGMLMASANDLIVLFLGLETLTIALFVLAGFHRRRVESGEAAMKYFVLSAFSSAFLLYGIALVYGATGSTNLIGVSTWLAGNVVVGNGLLLAGVGLLVVGFGFKIAAVPFHFWTPDVYQGSPSPVTAFMAGASKAAGFAALLRVFYSTFHVLRLEWQPLVWGLAVLTLLVGSTLAIVQSDVKRMLAYSSIAHAGYILVGLQAANELGLAGALFYVLAYTFMVMGSFAVVTIVSRRGDAAHDLDAYRGLYERRPALAVGFAVLLMAQAGVPFTSGFWAKFNVIAAAVDSRSYALALIAMLAAVIAAFFYLRLILVVFTSTEPSDDADIPAGRRRLPVPLAAGAAVVVTVAFTIVVGFLPAPVLDFARNASLIF